MQTVNLLVKSFFGRTAFGRRIADNVSQLNACWQFETQNYQLKIK